MKKIFAFLLTILLLNSATGQNFTLNCRDTTEHKTKIVMVPTPVPYDSTYQKCDTVLNIPQSELFGFYVAYDAFTLGDPVSEGGFLMKMQRMGVNMLNLYQRDKLYSSSNRDKIAAFVAKAKTQFGMKLITIDVRLTVNGEYEAWEAYYQKYGGTISMIEPLAEFEPYRLAGNGWYNDVYLPTYAAKYAHMFMMLQKMDALTKRYGAVMNWYEGWIGKGYSNPQAAVDSMVLHCGRIFVSNYVSMSRYLADIWDSSMIKRIDQGGSDYGGIAKACAKLKKPVILIEIGDIEPQFTQLFYSCPKTSTKLCNPFFGSTWDATKARFNSVSSPLVKQWVNLGGKTVFYTKLLPATGN